MKQKLLCLLPFFLLSGCGQATYKNASLPAEERAGLLLKELTRIFNKIIILLR